MLTALMVLLRSIGLLSGGHLDRHSTGMSTPFPTMAENRINI